MAERFALLDVCLAAAARLGFLWTWLAGAATKQQTQQVLAWCGRTRVRSVRKSSDVRRKKDNSLSVAMRLSMAVRAECGSEAEYGS